MAITGIITVTTAGTPVTGPAGQIGQVFVFCSHPDNTDLVWINAKAQGFPLKPGGTSVPVYVPNLGGLLFDADVSGEKVCWIQVR